MTRAGQIAQVSRAADLMAQRSREASTSGSGRWTLRPTPGYPQSIIDDSSKILIADTYTHPESIPMIAQYILSFDPAVGAQIASWLRDCVWLAERGECPVGLWDAAVSVASTWLREPIDGRPEVPAQKGSIDDHS